MTDKSKLESLYEDANYASTIGNYEEAFEIYDKLAETGHIGSMVALAHMYLRGEGVGQNVAKGIELMEVAASLGHSNAAFNLGALHRSGDCGVPKDPEKSRRFFLLAKELGCKLPIDEYIR
jgi:TPR repeat protein